MPKTKRKQTASQLANLRPLGTRAKSEERAIQRKGGIASGKVRAEKKTLKELMKLALNGTYKNEEGKEITIAEAITLAQIKKAIKGDSRAFELCGEYSGQKPAEKQEIEIKEPRRFIVEIVKPK